MPFPFSFSAPSGTGQLTPLALPFPVFMRHDRSRALPIPPRTATSARRDYKRAAILLAIFLAASALTPDSRRSIFTITSPLRIMRAEFPGAM